MRAAGRGHGAARWGRWLDTRTQGSGKRLGRCPSRGMSSRWTEQGTSLGHEFLTQFLNSVQKLLEPNLVQSGGYAEGVEGCQPCEERQPGISVHVRVVEKGPPRALVGGVGRACALAGSLSSACPSGTSAISLRGPALHTCLLLSNQSAALPRQPPRFSVAQGLRHYSGDEPRRITTTTRDTR